jgi:hypothetical protein
MQVHERYYGRRLRCTACRREFVARPAGDEAPDPAAESDRPERLAEQPAPPPAERSYTHACATCGATLRVHERYYGRRLRCTSCRTEFDARPAGAAGDAAEGEPPGTQQAPAPQPQPPAITHICSTCGAKLPIDPKYLGWTLRCTACKTEFVASPPPAERVPSRERGKPPAAAHGGGGAASAAAAGGAQAAAANMVSARRPEAPPRSPATHLEVVDGTPSPKPPSETRPENPRPPQGAPDELVAPIGTRIAPSPVATGGASSTPIERAGAEGPAEDSAPTRREPIDFELIPTPVPQPDPGSRRRWIVIAVAVALVATVALWWLGRDHREGLVGDALTPGKYRSDQGELHNDDGTAVAAALDREAVEELIDAVEDGDDAALSALASSSRCIYLAAGTRVRVLERRTRGAEARVRILNGPQSSRIVWVPARWIK